MLTPEQIRKEVDEYLDWTLKQRPLAERSIQTYKRNIRIFLEEMQIPPEDIEPEDVLEWRKDRLDRGYSVGSVNSILTCMRDYWKYLMKSERIDRRFDPPTLENICLMFQLSHDCSFLRQPS